MFSLVSWPGYCCNTLPKRHSSTSKLCIAHNFRLRDELLLTGGGGILQLALPRPPAAGTFSSGRVTASTAALPTLPPPPMVDGLLVTMTSFYIFFRSCNCVGTLLLLLEQLIIHVLFALCVANLHQHARARSADASGNNKMRAVVDRICDHTVDVWSTRDVPTNL